MYRTLLLLLCIAVTSGCRYYQVQPADPLTLESIIQMSSEGKTPEEILKEIENSRTVYELMTEDILKLKEGGVDPVVIDHMLATHRQAMESYYRYSYPYPYGPYYYHPYHHFSWYHCW